MIQTLSNLRLCCFLFYEASQYKRALRGLIKLVVCRFSFMYSLWYFHQMSTSCCLDQLTEGEKNQNIIWDIDTLKMANSLFLSRVSPPPRFPSLSRLSRKWLLTAPRRRCRSLPGCSAVPHLSSTEAHQSKSWIQVSTRYNERPLITPRHGHQWGALGGGGGMSTSCDRAYSCACGCVLMLG